MYLVEVWRLQHLRFANFALLVHRKMGSSFGLGYVNKFVLPVKELLEHAPLASVVLVASVGIVVIVEAALAVVVGSSAGIAVIVEAVLVVVAGASPGLVGVAGAAHVAGAAAFAIDIVDKTALVFPAFENNSFWQEPDRHQQQLIPLSRVSS